MSDEKEGEKPPRHKGQFQKGFDARRNLSARNTPVRDRKTIPALCRMHLPELVDGAIELFRDPETLPRDKIRILEVFADRGLGKAKAHTTVSGTVQHQHSAVSIDQAKLAGLTMEHALALLDAIVIDEPDAPSDIPLLADWSAIEDE